MEWFLLLLGVVMETGKNVFSNNFSKNVLKNDADVYKFNTMLYIGSFLILLVLMVYTGKWYVSGFTVITSLIFAVVTMASQLFFVKALQYGSMAFTTFVQGANLVIPTLFGILVYQADGSVLQLISVAFLLVAMALVLDVKKEKINKKWLLYAMLSMMFVGCIGIMQSVHQESEAHKGELLGFLTLAFLFAVLFNAVLWILYAKKEKATFSVKSSAVVQAASSGIFMGIVNVLYLYLAGVMNKVIFFPVSNGGLIFATAICGVIFFREKMNKKQIAGLILGVAAICGIGM